MAQHLHTALVSVSPPHRISHRKGEIRLTLSSLWSTINFDVCKSHLSTHVSIS